mmetsp:Transcript_88765/g.271835  ORF Transcript_88765/g.271835 Transcript_88765/m.271835 type:complete len:209 (+) Transcript_88765:365-991(+)
MLGALPGRPRRRRAPAGRPRRPAAGLPRREGAPRGDARVLGDARGAGVVAVRVGRGDRPLLPRRAVVHRPDVESRWGRQRAHADQPRRRRSEQAPPRRPRPRDARLAGSIAGRGPEGPPLGLRRHPQPLPAPRGLRHRQRHRRGSVGGQYRFADALAGPRWHHPHGGPPPGRGRRPGRRRPLGLPVQPHLGIVALRAPRGRGEPALEP